MCESPAPESPASAESPSPEGGRGWSLMRGTVDKFRASPSNGVSYLRRKSLEKAIGGSSSDNNYWSQAGYEPPSRFTELSCDDAKGSPLDFTTLAGKVTLCVNVATL